MNGWILAEFRLLASKNLFDIEQFIENFDTRSVIIPTNSPTYLKVYLESLQYDRIAQMEEDAAGGRGVYSKLFHAPNGMRVTEESFKKIDPSISLVNGEEDAD